MPSLETGLDVSGARRDSGALPWLERRSSPRLDTPVVAVPSERISASIPPPAASPSTPPTRTTGSLRPPSGRDSDASGKFVKGPKLLKRASLVDDDEGFDEAGIRDRLVPPVDPRARAVAMSDSPPPASARASRPPVFDPPVERDSPLERAAERLRPPSRASESLPVPSASASLAKPSSAAPSASELFDDVPDDASKPSAPVASPLLAPRSAERPAVSLPPRPVAPSGVAAPSPRPSDVTVPLAALRASRRPAWRRWLVPALGVVTLAALAVFGGLAFLGRAAQLDVRSVPSLDGAAVAIDGVPSGSLPLHVEVAPGHHVIGVTAPGHVPIEREVELSAGAAVSLEIVLEPTR